ncbi:thiamine-phosphate kinase [Shewanella sp. D64]|uniref:thiamine-phosphate kinase n=1 Tax=unclassified Shewanella TaxID=196818 RepID=UPI0022BA16D9|nr:MULTISPECIES: thiamine-phosphate kinase [unclassified Shewanella]MEC4727915.1 thiamine-phosphate kinase [Shewanella sp. D64]MEC4739957.1 thiamine-phosphate kinase [Shewanella sp. E94]WBJ97081.1 thiamine-phosphate kinase [Shewanella sp. MTB7]
MKEFQLIEKFFTKQTLSRRDVELGIGDDCALVIPAVNKSIAISCDTLVENVHFYPDIPPKALGYKSLAVNLSDLASMGAEPAWMTLALTLPDVDEAWLTSYSAGLFEAAEYYNIALVGGDTTRGPRSITITVNGQVPTGTALTRNGARNGDWIYVTGTLGDSALGLDVIRGSKNVAIKDKDYLVNRHYYPTPRLLAGQALRNLASSAIDLSDGLLSDIQHVLKLSGMSAVIDVDLLPLSDALKRSVNDEEALSYALTGGEDYELLFSVPEAQKGALEIALANTGVSFSQIGQICTGDKLRLIRNGHAYIPTNIGFEHFS